MDYIEQETGIKLNAQEIEERLKHSSKQANNINVFPDSSLNKGVELIKNAAEWFKILGIYADYKLTSDQKEALEAIITIASLTGAAAKIGGKAFKFNDYKHADKTFDPEHKFDTEHHTTHSNKNEQFEANKHKFKADGDYAKLKVVAMYEKISHEIPEGRIDYTKGFLQDLENFKKDTVNWHHGPLKEDLYLVNYHDYDKEIGFGKDKRTISWATHIEVGNKMPTMANIHQHLALVEPDWSKRDAVTLIKIPKGTDATFISGRAGVQYSDTGKRFEGGGFQVRFRDFDEKWIIETRKVK